MNRPKQQGTRFETWIVNKLHDNPFSGARRVAEGGIRDQGDITFLDCSGRRWTVEAKARQALNVTRTLAKAKRKAPDGDLVAVVWKRLVRGDGKRRVPDGEPVVVVVDFDTWMRLLSSVG